MLDYVGVTVISQDSLTIHERLVEDKDVEIPPGPTQLVYSDCESANENRPSGSISLFG